MISAPLRSVPQRKSPPPGDVASWDSRKSNCRFRFGCRNLDSTAPVIMAASGRMKKGVEVLMSKGGRRGKGVVSDGWWWGMVMVMVMVIEWGSDRVEWECCTHYSSPN